MTHPVSGVKSYVYALGLCCYLKVFETTMRTPLICEDMVPSSVFQKVSGSRPHSYPQTCMEACLKGPVIIGQLTEEVSAL